jgi:hypothetical protein
VDTADGEIPITDVSMEGGKIKKWENGHLHSISL